MNNSGLTRRVERLEELMGERDAPQFVIEVQFISADDRRIIGTKRIVVGSGATTEA